MANPNWKPGISGNPAGRPKGRIRRGLFEEWADKNKLLEHCQRTLLNAAKGKTQSKLKVETARYLLEQLIGKAPQTLEHTGESGAPIQINIVAEKTGIMNDNGNA